MDPRRKGPRNAHLGYFKGVESGCFIDFHWISAFHATSREARSWMGVSKTSQPVEQVDPVMDLVGTP